jgi:amino acid transporter
MTVVCGARGNECESCRLRTAARGAVTRGNPRAIDFHRCAHVNPVATIPLVAALAGNGTWLAYILATVAILFVAWSVGRFARYSSSPGSLYSYVTMILPRWLSATAGWSLLLAYGATGASNIGGFYQYANIMLRDSTGHIVSTVLLSALITGVRMWFAWRDIKISARLMLSFEAVSMTLIVVVVALVLARHGLHGRPEPASPAWYDQQRAPVGARARAIQLCRL